MKNVHICAKVIVLIIKMLCRRKIILVVSCSDYMCQKVAYVSGMPGWFYLVSAGFTAIQI